MATSALTIKGKKVPMVQTAGNSRHSGFTLIELLITIALAVILVTLAVPGFQGTMARSQLAGDFNQILTGVHFARSEAARQRGDVTVVLTSGAGGSGWSLEVWQGDGAIAVSCPADAECLKMISEDSSRVVVSTVPNDGKVTFNALGRAVSTCSVSTPCSVSVSHPSLPGNSESLAVNSLGNIYRTDS